jgi:hypothetical protein
VTVVDRPTISGQFSGLFMLTFAVPSALGHAAARAPPAAQKAVGAGTHLRHGGDRIGDRHVNLTCHQE